MSHNCGKLSVMALALALGLTSAIATFVLGLLATYTGFGADAVTLSASVHPGFTATFWGSVIGAIWAFVDWFIGGLILGWLYNAFLKCCSKSSE